MFTFVANNIAKITRNGYIDQHINISKSINVQPRNFKNIFAIF